MHPVIIRQLAADHIKEMHAKAEDRTPGPPGAPGPASRVHPAKAPGQR